MAASSDHSDFDVAIIGAGPGGYVAAIRAAQLGKKVCLIDERETLGGTCLNVGCIPSKALLESSELYAITRHGMDEHGISVGEVGLDVARMMARKTRIVDELTSGLGMLMKKNKVVVRRGRGRLADTGGPIGVAIAGPDGATETVTAAAVILAMGSVPIELPFMPFDGERVVSSTEALAFEEVPGHLAVVGGGVIGLELGSVWARLGAKVTVVELLPHILPPSDRKAASVLQRALKKQGLELRLECKVGGAKVGEDGVALTYTDKKGAEQTLECDRVLVAVGRRPATKGAGLEGAGIAFDEAGRVAVDEHFRTNVPGVYAIGDLIAGVMLAHKAEEEGMAVAEILAGKPGHVNYEAIPNIVYTWPELAEVGMTEEQAREAGVDFKVGKYSFKPNGRAKTLVGDADGMVKVLADAKTDRLLGVQIVGPRASDMIAELVVAFEFSASAEDIARTVHAHPTLAEIVKEAALAVDGRVIHG